MRLEFKHPSQAKRWFKISKLVLASAVSGQEGLILPTQRIRNAMCRGFGYSSFEELEYLLKQRGNGKFTPPSTNEILHAFSVGFFLALSETRDLGFRQEVDEKQLAARLAQRTLELVNERESELANEREFLGDQQIGITSQLRESANVRNPDRRIDVVGHRGGGPQVRR